VTMSRILLGSAVAVLVSVAAGPAIAHHSFSAEYDQNKPIKLTGKVTEMLWSNPHAWIHLDVTGKDGKVVNWAFETGGANALYRRGWRRQDLVPGTVLVVDAFRARSGTPTANAVSITFPDGRTLFSGGSAPGANPDTK
jgi:hypothetical protein